MNLKGDYIDGGLSVQISSMFANHLEKKEISQCIHESTWFRFKNSGLFKYKVFRV